MENTSYLFIHLYGQHNFKKAFLYLSTRISIHFKSVAYITKIYEKTYNFQEWSSLNVKNIQLRAIYFDDK
ncbi:hypothetical protein LFU01_17320 [Lysinibacillus fusiformis]|nr:hypothetical protein LFU01_17320 [Lysinibacillus fusiformis]